MNNYKVKIILCVVGIVLFWTAFFLNPQFMIEKVNESLQLCITVLIPTLFPFMVLSDFIVRSRLGDILGSFFEPITRLLFRLPGNSACAVLMSAVGGYPTGAKMTAQLVEEGRLSTYQGKRMMLFCINAGPAFVVGTVGTVMFSSRSAGIILYLSMVIASLVMGVFSRILEKETIPLRTKKITFETKVISQSVMNGLQSTLLLCAWVLLFSCVNSLTDIIPLPENISHWAKLVTEVTGACITASKNFPVSIQALIMGWAGLSVHCQLLPYIKTVGLKYSHFMLSRIIHGAASATVADLLFRIFPCETSVFSTSTEVLPQLYSVSVPAAIFMMILGAMLITEISVLSKKNNG